MSGGCGCPTQQAASAIAVSCKDWDYSKQPHQECLRLNLGVTFEPRPDAPRQQQQQLRSASRMVSYSPTTSDPRPVPDPAVFSQQSRVSFSASFPAGQDPTLAFVGWTTANFKFLASQFTSRPQDVGVACRFGQSVTVRASGRRRSHTSQELPDPSTSFSSAFLVCLSDLLPQPSPSLLHTSQQ